MIIQKLNNAASHKITVTGTAASIIDLINTAGSTVHNFAGKVNGVDLKVESGAIRICKDNDPTSSDGYLVNAGEVYLMRNVTLSKVNLISAEAGSAIVSLQLGITVEGESSSHSVAGGSGSSSSSSEISETSGGDLSSYTATPGGVNGDATVAYTSATTITISSPIASFPASFIKENIASIRQIPNSGGAGVQDIVYSDKADFSVTGSVITVAGATFAATDSFVVVFKFLPKNTDETNLAGRTVEINGPQTDYDLLDLVDTTNVAATTHYYPASTGFSMDGYKDFSFSGKLIDADGTLTVTVEGTNDEDVATADWVQVYGYDDKNNATVNSWTITNGTLTLANHFINANYKRLRVVLVASGATNTVIIKGRRKAL